MSRDLTTSCKRCRTRRIRTAAAGSILGTVLILSALSWLDGSASTRGRPTFKLLSFGPLDGIRADQEAPFGIIIAPGLFGSDEKLESPVPAGRQAKLPLAPTKTKSIRVAAIERTDPSRGRTSKS